MLVAALVGPFFIDWTNYRSTFEIYAERALGHKVTVLGEADLRLLPAPSISFSDVRVGEAEDPLLVVSNFDMRVELTPLLKGEIRVIEMVLERPHLSLPLDEEGRLDWLTANTTGGAIAKLEADHIAFNKITIRNGALSVIDARSGETHRIDNGNLVVSARSLSGPFKASGSLTMDEAPLSVSFATGQARKESGIRIKGEITPTRSPVNFTFDGNLSEKDALPAFDGEFSLSSVNVEEAENLAWRSDGTFVANMAEVIVPEFELRFGPEDKRLGLTGKADLQYADEKRFQITAKSKQVDFDRLMGGGPQAPVGIDVAGRQLVEVLRAVPLPSIKGEIALDVPAVVAGGGILQNVKLDLETMLGGWRISRLAARLPGRTTIATQGDLGLEPALTYRGVVSVKAEQPGPFLNWWRQTDLDVGAMDPLSLEGRLNLVPEGAALDNMRLSLAGADATGGLSYRIPRIGNTVFSLSLDADRVDLEQLQNLSVLITPEKIEDDASDDSRGLDVSLRLRADAIVAGDVEGEGLTLEAEYSDGGLRIDRLIADDLAGAKLDVSGEIRELFSAPVGAVEGVLDAQDLTALVLLSRSVFPNSAFVERLAKAAPSLVPARFDGKLEAAALGDATDVSVLLEGVAGNALANFEAAFKGRVDTWREAEIDIALSMNGPDGSKMLQQLGFDVIPVASLGIGSLSLDAKGIPKDGIALTVNATAGSSLLDGTGSLSFKKDADPDYRLSLSARSEDLTPIALLSGQFLPMMSGALPADLDLVIEGVGPDFAISKANGLFGETRFDARLEGAFAPSPGENKKRVTGEVTLSEADLRSLSEIVLGPDQWFSIGDGTSIWPIAPFGQPLLSGIDASIYLKADRLVVAEGYELTNPRADLRVSSSLLRLDALSGAYAGGTLEGSLSVRRNEAEAAVTGRMKLDGADLRQVVWRPEGRAVASGSMDLFLEFESAGRSISALVTGLSGGGTFSLEDGEFRSINPQAFPLVTRAVDAGLDLEDDKISEVFVNHMAAGSLPFKRVDGTLTLVGGRLSGRNVVVDSERAEVFGSAEVDLGTYELDADFSLKVSAGQEAVTGAEPQVGLLFEGDIDQPSRRVDIAPLTAYLTLRAFEKEVERVEKLQAEILERDRLVRELKVQREARATRERLAIEAAEKAAEEDRLRLEREAEAEEERKLQEEADSASEAQVPFEPDQSNEASAADRADTDRLQEALTITENEPILVPNDGQDAVRQLSNLPPLDPPVTIDDLIIRDATNPFSLENGR